MSDTDYNHVLNMWLRNIKDVYAHNQVELDSIKDEELKSDHLVELIVKQQVINLAKTSVIQRAWKKRNAPDLHGWVYGLKDGLIKPVFEMKANEAIDSIYTYGNL